MPVAIHSLQPEYPRIREKTGTLFYRVLKKCPIKSQFIEVYDTIAGRHAKPRIRPLHKRLCFEVVSAVRGVLRGRGGFAQMQVRCVSSAHLTQECGTALCLSFHRERTTRRSGARD